MGISRKHIIRRRRVFNHMRKKGNTYVGKYLVINVLNEIFDTRRHVDIDSKPLVYSPPEIQFAFITPKKLGKAYLRNKIRKRLKEIARKSLPYIVPKNTIIIIARWTSPKASYQELEIDFHGLLKRSKKWKIKKN